MGIDFNDKAKAQEKLVNKRSFELGRKKGLETLSAKSKRNREAIRFKGRISKADSTRVKRFSFRKTLEDKKSDSKSEKSNSKISESNRKRKKDFTKRVNQSKQVVSKRTQAAQHAKNSLKNGGKNAAFGVLGQNEDLEDLQNLNEKATQAQNFVTNSKKASRFFLNRKAKKQNFAGDTRKSLRFRGQSVKVPKAMTNQLKQQGGRQATKGFFSKLLVQGGTKGAATAAMGNPVSLGVIGIIAGVIAAVLLLGSVFSVLFGEINSSAQASTDGVFYVEHWDGKDAYHSSFLAQRYGITEQQIDDFIESQGFKNLDDRASGKEFLKLQQESGIDVRVLVAFAQMESSYGTAGVAAEYPKSNLFGYGAFDNDPDQGASWDNSRAVQDFRTTQIDGYGNKTLAICDERASQFHAGTLQPGQAVYWTAENSGKARATIEEALDKYIDSHGGTPKPPGGYGTASGGGAGLTILDKVLGQVIPGTYGGETGQCYAVPAYYAHSINPVITLRNGVAAANIGSDYDWKAWGWTVVPNPKYSDLRAGDIICFNVGANMGTWIADSNYGHVGVVGKVLGNNQFLLYDQNPGPLKTWTVIYVTGGVASVIHPPGGK